MNSSHRSKASHDLLDEVELLDEPGGGRVRLRFDGPFEGSVVRWQASLFTPQAWASRFDEEPPRQNIIDIREESGRGLILNICLKVSAIDRPTLRKAVMMVRQYKRLQRGLHRYG